MDQDVYIEKGVPVICPICKSTKKIHIPQNILKEKGLTTMSILKDTICDHHFQIFIDNNLKVRGYQKVDFELIDDLNVISYKCKLCDIKIKIKLDDESSYIKKEPHKSFLGKNLNSYKVAHYYNDELHINTILVDQDGYVNDTINPQVVKLENYANNEKPDLKFFKYTDEKKSALKSHSTFNLFLIFNTYNHWIYELVCSLQFNSIELSNLLFQKIQEASNLYSKTPSYLSVLMADKIFHLWISKSNVICINLKTEQSYKWLDPVMKEFINSAIHKGTLISNSNRFLLINEFFKEDVITSDTLPLIKRMIFDDLFYSKIQIKYIDHVDRIIQRLFSEFDIEKVFVLGFFYQSKSIIDFIKNLGNYDDFEEFIEMIDFINRRKLIT